MTSPIISETAAAELIEIWEYTYRTWGEPQAERYLRLLNAAFERVGLAPGVGRDRSEYLPEMRSVAVERHVVFYRAFGPDVVILRVVHQRRDMAAMGFEG